MEKETIGIIGAGAGAGTTHLTLLLANYLSGVKNRKTAVLEWNSHGDFDRFGVCCLGLGETKDQYQILGVSYFPRADNETLVQCMCGDFQAVLLDCGREEAFSVCCKRWLSEGIPLCRRKRRSKRPIGLWSFAGSGHYSPALSGFLIKLLFSRLGGFGPINW